MYQRRRRSVLLAVLLVAVVALVVGQINSPESADPQQAGAGQNLAVAPAVPSAIAPTGAASSAAAAQPTTRPTATEPITTVQRTDGFAYAGGPGPVLGTAGTLRRFKVAVERGEGQNASTFAAAVERTLGDPRSWIAGRQVRWQRVAERTGAEFTIFLASAATSERMCARGGLRTARYT
ncbi:MAG TPA: DUF3152 domain-containing protein, partial [Actinoplanes sp.]|nr:DUF3152 domain-containing protein [Actinoplanes sp.]